jgi:tetratricopeptide (TPR) repeat protein
VTSNESGDGAAVADANQVYVDPVRALGEAREVLESPSASQAEKADALWTLGRSAYYANQMSDAVQLLQDALPLTTDHGVYTEILLTLAPALSKEGHPRQALDILERLSPQLEAKFLGQVRNQRGIILVELGRLPEAMVEFVDALRLLEVAGDQQRQPRTLINLGALSSLMGDLADAERWFGQARELTRATGQDVLAATIEGNLGYVESRRGNYAKALDWYQQARVGFVDLGDVALLVAELEIDHARTLLDVGLAVDAADAASKAVGSATRGGNQMLETRGRLLLAEALVQLGEDSTARDQIAMGQVLADRLGQKPWRLRAMHLRSRLGPSVAAPAGSESTQPELSESDPLADVRELVGYRWVREAYDSALHGAERLRSTDPSQAAAVLSEAERLTTDLDVHPVDRAHGALLLAVISEDEKRAATAFYDALAAVRDQRDLLGSTETRVTTTQRLGPLEDLAISVARRSSKPAEAVHQVLEQAGAVRNSSLKPDDREPVPDELRAELRSAQVALEETKLADGDVEVAAEAVRLLEKRILEHGRIRSVTGNAPSVAGVSVQPEPFDGSVLPTDTGFAAYAVHGRRLLAVSLAKGQLELVDLGPLDRVDTLVRSQRSALRRLTDARRERPEQQLERLHSVNAGLEALLLEPLPLAECERIVIAPSSTLQRVSWPGFPSLRSRPVTIAPTVGAWHSERRPLNVGSVSLLGGPGLTTGTDELRAIETIWGSSAHRVDEASCDEAAASLTSADLVHLSAHGLFRSDNPFFSALRFADGDLSLLEMSSLRSLPSAVVLSSCDGGAAASLAAADATAVGTATELRRLGSSMVVAPTTVVNDNAAAEFSITLHRCLAGGLSVDESVLAARTHVSSLDDPRLSAAGAVFQLFGGRCTRKNLALSSLF